MAAWLVLPGFLLIGLAHAQANVEQKNAEKSVAPAADAHSQTFARVNGRDIPTQEYEAAFTSLMRQKFYHGKVPENEIATDREEVKRRLVQRIVLLEEAQRRGIAADAGQIEQAIADYDKRYAASPAWRDGRERLVPGLKAQLAEQSLVAQLETQLRKVPEPAESEVRAFYEANPELFTEPEKLRLSIILLTVDPSSPATTWEATRAEAQAIYQRLAAGADFAEASRLHSGAYTETNGDMGYLHRGMLPEQLHARIDNYVLGKVNEPVETLQGMAIFRLDERVPPKKRDFADVAQRAQELLIRQRQDKAWKDLVDRLVAAADVKFFHGVQSKQGESDPK
jgi:parvulin-like peptidyl-prolyl isomerase